MDQVLAHQQNKEAEIELGRLPKVVEGAVEYWDVVYSILYVVHQEEKENRAELNSDTHP
jgi:hypothetical protein